MASHDNEVRCYCRIVHKFSWESKDPVALQSCDGLAIASNQGRPTGRVADTLVSQRMRDARETGKARAAQGAPGMAEIQQSLSARRLLAELAHSHGLQPDKYRVWSTRDGHDRIRAGSRNLTVSDFLTRRCTCPGAKLRTSCAAPIRGNWRKPPCQRHRKRPAPRSGRPIPPRGRRRS
ncbi:hypothetical protein [Cupriavidus necator]